MEKNPLNLEEFVVRLYKLPEEKVLNNGQTAFEHGWLQLAFLEVGSEKAAAYLNFDYDNRIWVYNSGIDTNFGVYSPGWVLLSYLLQWANEHGRQSFDFMRGSEDYKYRFGGVDRFISRVKIERMNR